MFLMDKEVVCPPQTEAFHSMAGNHIVVDMSLNQRNVPLGFSSLGRWTIASLVVLEYSFSAPAQPPVNGRVQPTLRIFVFERFPHKPTAILSMSV